MERFGFVRRIAFACALIFCGSALAQVAPQAGNVAQSSPPKPYLLQAGDEIEIRAFNLPEVSQIVRIRPDGKISLLLLDDVEAAGSTPEQLGKRLSDLYAKHFRSPHITVSVRNFSQSNVFVGGDVHLPGMVPMLPGVSLTAAAAIFRAGGFKDAAATQRVVLLRNDANGVPSTTYLNMQDVLSQGKPDVVLQPSDVLFIPRNQIMVYVGGEVLEPGLFPLEGTMTALAAVIRAKGFRPTAHTKKVILLRDSGQGKAIVSVLNLDDAAKGRPDAQLKPFDVVFVPKTNIAKVNQFVEQYIRQVIPVQTSVGFSYILGGIIF